MTGDIAFGLSTTGSRTDRSRIAVLGMGGNEYLAGSLMRAAERLGLQAVMFDAMEAWRGRRLMRAFNWRFRDRRPLAGPSYFSDLRDRLARNGTEVLIATGLVPLDRGLLRELRAIGITTVNYSTDDPWNSAMASRWFQDSLPEYDIIFTPRRANIADFERAGCRDVRYLPFGYDERLLAFDGFEALAGDVLFVGGADDDRAGFMRQFVRQGPSVALVGGYWNDYADLRAHALGVKTWHEVAALTRAAKVNLCLVRRANRDGHVMRSLEIAACGGCMLAEDTAEHRDLFGADDDAVRYFTTAEEAAQRARALIADRPARERLAARLRRRVGSANHSYVDRVATMVDAACALPQRRAVAGRDEAGC